MADFAEQQTANSEQTAFLGTLSDDMDEDERELAVRNEVRRLQKLYPNASLSILSREISTTSGIGRIERQQSLDAIAAARRTGKITEDMLDLPGLRESDRLQIEGLPEFEDNALRKEREGLTKEAEKSFGNALKGVEGAYTGADAQGNLVPSPEGGRIVKIMQRELADKLAEVRNDPAFKDASEARIYGEATKRTIKWARDEQGLVRLMQLLEVCLVLHLVKNLMLTCLLRQLMSLIVK